MKNLFNEKYNYFPLKKFSFHNNAHFILIKYLKSWNINSKYIIVSGPTGIGKTTLIQTISKLLKYHINEINPYTENYKDILNGLNNATLNGYKQLLLLEDFDQNSNENFLRNILKNKPACPVVICCNDIYNSCVYKLKNQCDIVKLRLNKSDIVRIIKETIKQHNFYINDKETEKLINIYNQDLRALLNNLKLMILRKNCKTNTNESIIMFKNIFKMTEDIFGCNLKYANKLLNYYDFLNRINEHYGVQLFEFSFMNYPLFCRMFKYFHIINESNFCYSTFPAEYQMQYLDVYNKHCRVNNQKIQIIVEKPQINKFKAECKDFERTQYLKMIIKKYIKEKSHSSKQQIKIIIQEYPFIINLFDDETKLYLNECKNFGYDPSQIFEEIKAFNIVYKENRKSGARVDVSIYDLFK